MGVGLGEVGVGVGVGEWVWVGVCVGGCLRGWVAMCKWVSVCKCVFIFVYVGGRGECGLGYG